MKTHILLDRVSRAVLHDWMLENLEELLEFDHYVVNKILGAKNTLGSRYFFDLVFGRILNHAAIYIEKKYLVLESGHSIYLPLHAPVQRDF